MRATVLDSATFAGSSDIIVKICTASDVELLVSDTSSLMVAPIANTSAADSPMILPIASSVAVNIPENALGRTTLKVVCVSFAPSASEANL